MLIAAGSLHFGLGVGSPLTGRGLGGGTALPRVISCNSTERGGDVEDDVAVVVRLEGAAFSDNQITIR